MSGIDNFLIKDSDSFYTPEALLSSWLNLSILILTTSMLFYHLNHVQSIKADKRIAAVVSISLLICGVMYAVISLRNYVPRVNDVILSCKADKDCPEAELNRMHITKTVNVAMTTVTLVIELVVAYLIFKTILVNSIGIASKDIL